MTREEFEKALDERRLWIREYHHNTVKNYLVRRNGATKEWKREPLRWEVPIKWKLKSTARISDKTELDSWFTAQPGPDELVGEELLNAR